MQSEAMLLFLFSIYKHDFENELIKECFVPVYLQGISLLLLMYADDTVLLSETDGCLQTIIGSFHTHSSKWNFSLNIENTNIVVFRNSAKLSSKETYVCNNESSINIDCFDYLGLTITINATFTTSKNNNIKAIVSQVKKCL